MLRPFNILFHLYNIIMILWSYITHDKTVAHIFLVTCLRPLQEVIEPKSQSKSPMVAGIPSEHPSHLTVSAWILSGGGVFVHAGLFGRLLELDTRESLAPFREL